MKLSQHLFTLTLAIASGLALSGCGSSPPTTASQPPALAPTPAPPPATAPTTLTGNWLLAGSRVPETDPFLSTTLIVKGNQITGQGRVKLQCGSFYTVEGLLALSGQIANNGSFKATFTNPASADVGPYSVSISGNSPAASSPNVWNGSYSLMYTAVPKAGAPSCTYTHSDSFAATPIASLTASYSGPAQISNPAQYGSLGANASYKLQIVQGSPALTLVGTETAYQLLLTATLTVTGSKCFSTGTTTGFGNASNIQGDALVLVFTMDDGSHMVLNGTLTDPLGSSIDIDTSVSGGTCDGVRVLSTLKRS